MKLYINQKVFSWSDQFTVKDESGKDRWYVQGELISWGKKLHVYNTRDEEVVFIQQKMMSFLPRYYVFVNGEQVAEIVKELTFLRPKYSIRGLGWEIEGSFWAHDYQMTRSGTPVVRIHKKWMTWGDCYELDISDEQDEYLALAVVLAIDCAMDTSGATVAVSG